MAELPLPEPALTRGDVLLRPWRETDVPAIAQACSDPNVVRFLVSLPSPYTEDDARGWLATQEPNRLAGTSLDMAVAHRGTGAMLGSLGTRVNARTRSANIGYWLAPEAQGHGYMTTAV